ncbi:hypothetical protein [Spirosoma aerophilum]
MSVLTASVLSFSACTDDVVTTTPGLPYQSSFQRDADGWVAGLTDYGTAQDSIMQFKSAWKGLPAPLDTTRKSIMIESMNRSDDAFMFLKKKLTGLTPNTDYSLVFDVELASQYPANSIGIGGSPGSSVFLKVGASAVEPVRVLKDGFYTINIDKGEQNNDGKDAIRIGNISTGDSGEGYSLITRTNQATPLKTRTNAQGELWLIVGTDSGFEGLTTLYYSKINVTTKATM